MDRQEAPSRRPSWGIKARITAIAFAAVAATSVIAGISLFATSDIQQASATGNEFRQRISTITTVRLQATELVLTAMDSIVDKDEGSIHPDRLKSIDANIRSITEKLPQIRETARMLKLDDEAGRLGDDFATLAKVIRTDLKDAIEKRADKPVFDRLDDAIDGSGDKFVQDLETIDSHGQQRLESQFAGIDATVGRVSNNTKIALAAALALLLPLVFFIARGIVRALDRLSGSMTRLADGDKSTEIPYAGRRDEIGAMARAVEIFKGSMIENERLEAERRDSEARAREDAERREKEQRAAEARAEEERLAAEERVREERRSAMLSMADTFEKSIMAIVGSLGDATGEVRTSAQQMAGSAERSHRQAITVATASEEATSNVQTVATAAEQLSASVSEISRQVARSNEIAQNAVVQANDTNAKVEGLAEGAQKIGEVIGLINDIASQTNLLALNATIEAARAGEAGKGFAVVATEVKSLADQTAKATDEIGSQISTIQTATDDAVQAIRSIGSTIGEMGEIASAIAAAIEEQGAATADIASNVQQAADGTRKVSHDIAGVTEAANESEKASASILESADGLAREGERLNEEVERFLQTVRAG